MKNDPELTKEIEEKIMANIDNLAPIQSKGKVAKGKSKKQAIEEAEAETDTEDISEEDFSDNTIEITTDDSSDGGTSGSASSQELDDLMLDIKM